MYIFSVVIHHITIIIYCYFHILLFTDADCLHDKNSLFFIPHGMKHKPFIPKSFQSTELSLAKYIRVNPEKWGTNSLRFVNTTAE
jgi:hypothetical protein